MTQLGDGSRRDSNLLNSRRSSRAATDAAALRAIDDAKGELHERIQHIKAAPQDDYLKLVVGRGPGTSLLDVIADGLTGVRVDVGFGITIGIVAAVPRQHRRLRQDAVAAAARDPRSRRSCRS